jgi:hypothetical protein
MGWCAECLFECIGSNQRCAAIELILLKYFLRNINPTMLCVQLLYTALTREDVCKIVYTQRLLGSRVYGRHRFGWHISLNVVQLCGNLTLLEYEFLLSRHNNKFLELGIPPAKITLLFDN